MSAQQRYAGLAQVERRQAAHLIRRAIRNQQLNQQHLDVWAELALFGVLNEGKVDLFWVYAWELGSRIYELRRGTYAVAGA